jgi:membrane-associated phospholipid phosphatase
MASLTRTLTKPRQGLAAAPLRLLLLLFGLLSCLQATQNAAAFYAAAQFAFGALLLFAAVAPLRRAIPVFAYALVTMVFVRIRAVADETSIPVQYEYPIVFEEVIFGGKVLNAWVQDFLYVPGRIGPLDVALAAVYFSYFLAPAAMTLILWKVRPALFPRFAWALVLTLMIGLVAFFLVPTAPPWLASDSGQLETVHRVIPPFSAALAGNSYEQAAEAFDQNAVAAMPSLHVALTVVIAAVLAQFGPRWKRAGVAYVVAMCFALIYLGEHYLIDELAGLALGVGAWRATKHASQLGHRHAPVKPDGARPVVDVQSHAALPDTRNAS